MDPFTVRLSEEQLKEIRDFAKRYHFTDTSAAIRFLCAWAIQHIETPSTKKTLNKP
ncbi:MAG: hypothetical protein ABQ298_03570 [Puniceicoccaceae bacterium]